VCYECFRSCLKTRSSYFKRKRLEHSRNLRFNRWWTFRRFHLA
jgi:hypothetical protein